MLGNMKNVKKIVVSWRRSGQLRRRAGPISAPVAEEVVIKLLPVLGDLAAVTARALEDCMPDRWGWPYAVWL